MKHKYFDKAKNVVLQMLIQGGTGYANISVTVI
jgi:hypothetical protein